MTETATKNNNIEVEKDQEMPEKKEQTAPGTKFA